MTIKAQSVQPSLTLTLSTKSLCLVLRSIASPYLLFKYHDHTVQQVVGVPRSSSQTEQPLPPRMAPQGSVNLYSFVSAGRSIPSSSSSSSSVGARVGVGVGRSSSVAASSIGPLRATAVASASPPPAPPPPNQATGQATESSSAAQLEPARETSNISSNLFDHVDWEAGALLGGQEELDETSLRMEMKTSMDIHRLMRSRQKVRLFYMLVFFELPRSNSNT